MFTVEVMSAWFQYCNRILFRVKREQILVSTSHEIHDRHNFSDIGLVWQSNKLLTKLQRENWLELNLTTNVDIKL